MIHVIRGLVMMALFGGFFQVMGVEPEKQYLWPEGAPYAKGTEEKDKPYLDIYVPTQSNTGAAIVVCPGGGYGGLAMDHEGKQVAEWLNGLGVTAFVLNYRHNGKGYQNPAPLTDVQRAVRYARFYAKERAIDPNRIGIMGFSAGGHLASSAGTHFQKSAYELKDKIDAVSCRPDFMVLVYPVITLEPPYYHGGSRRNLLGDTPSEELVKSFCNHLQVTAETPPTFLVHANDDTAVPPENSIMFYEACRKAGVAAEMHIYLKGSHGFGMRKGVGPAEGWIDRCAEWMKLSGFLTPASK